MKKTKFNRIGSLLLCVVLIAAMALFASGCGNTKKSDADTITVQDGETLGEGAVSFPLTITDKDGNEVNVTIKTNETTVGGALLALNLIAGEDGDYGLYIKSVNGITADYDKDGTYWAFYVDGEYAMAGVDTTEITAGSVYALKIE